MTSKASRRRSPLLELEHVSVAFGALKAVDRISLTVGDGERRALIGPNGAGKTTLFNAICGTARTSEGRVIFAGRDVTRRSEEHTPVLQSH